MSTPVADIAPIPGDVAGIRTHAAKLTRAADAISSAILLIRGVKDAASSEQSDAVDALAGQIDNLQERLADIRGRYETAGSELSAFATALDDAQGDADRAVSTRDSAVGEITRLEGLHNDAQYRAASATEPTVREELEREIRTLDRSLEEQHQVLQGAQRTHFAAVDAVRVAGDAAADRLAGVVRHDGVNDSWWDDVMDWVSANSGWLSLVKNILGAVTAIIGIISIFLPVLAPVAFILGAATALLSFALASAGEGSWLDFGLDMIGVLTFGVGAVAARGVSLGLRGMQITRGLSANRTLTTLCQRVLHPIATRRAAISAVGDGFQSVLPAGQTLITRQTGLQRLWLESSGIGVEQFKTITQASDLLGSASVRSAVFEGLAEVPAGIYQGAQGVGTVAALAGLGSLVFDEWDARAGDLPAVPVLDDVASFWVDAQSATTAPVTTWHPNAGIQ